MPEKLNELSPEKREQLRREYYAVFDRLPKRVRDVLNEQHMPIIDAFEVADEDILGWCRRNRIGILSWVLAVS